ncbi:ATP-binding protein [Variovorax arabinosiphilus]|uniref:ATP-binding protein n=1 Tax=Variovorax arabinosiphilus TaxID=3053498 RepID=UPI0025781809|nr:MULTISPECIES: winged helix-turn-helix domain-containing protein [unclassified Variovorax]MDM0123296.1 winged helix-turn-helix domain-containing protein [Variovorax sp. J2L1-78]MDM0131708.1 winged helix-turn-helix domain-containing protein [Variovorax sp. J2L1-63]MDM0236059.1 winged helix-turn-helix domain-containing protein [Variovorax sp. J2R1-6]
MQAELPDRKSQSFAFGPFLLVPGRSLLLQGGVPVRIGGSAVRILTVLVERAGEVVNKRALMDCVWPGTMTDECHLKVNMAALRRALGDEPGVTRYIAPVRGGSYRFVAPVRAGSPFALEEPPTCETPPSHNLPLARTRIFGRADEIDLLRRDLDEARLVSIVGCGGAGKTTVALAVAEQAIDAYRDGVWLVEMALIRDPDLVASAIAMTVGLAANFADMLPAVCDHLRDREMLLVLDNCEHVAAATARCVARLLANTTGVRLLVTSRTPLWLGGERVRWLPGLGLPVFSGDMNADEALLFPAIQLFVDRAANALESFELCDADAPTVAEICKVLDGLPLAVELAATRIDSFGPDDLLRQLAGSEGPQRQCVLPKMLDWSDELLATRHATLLRTVSVFAGTFDVEDASAVSGLPQVEAARALAALLAKSLIVADVDGENLVYRLLDTVRDHGLRRLHASGEALATRQRHAEHVCTVLKRATAEWAWRPAGEWGSRYGRFLYDLREALASFEKDGAHGSLRVRLSVAGLRLWDHFSHTEECRRQVSHAIDHVDAAGLSGSVDEMQLCAWLAGATMFTRGFVPQAMVVLRRALQIANRIGSADYRLRCLRMIGIYELSTGEHEAGRRTLEAFAFLAAMQDASALPESETNLALAELFLGHLSSARQRLERVLAGDLHALVHSHSVPFSTDCTVDAECVLSQPLWLTGSPDAAMRAAATAIHRAPDGKFPLSSSNALSNACSVFYWSGHFETCHRYVEMLDAHVGRHGFLFRRPVVMFYRAALACAQSEVPSEGAISALEQSIAEFHAVHHLARLPYHLCVLAEFLAKRGRLADAETTIRAALERASATRERWCVPELMRVQATILNAAGQTHEADKRLLESMSLAREIGALSWQLRTGNDLAQSWRSQARGRDAREILLRVHGRFLEGFGTRDLVTAACVLASLQGHESA